MTISSFLYNSIVSNKDSVHTKIPNDDNLEQKFVLDSDLYRSIIYRFFEVFYPLKAFTDSVQRSYDNIR